MNIYQDFFPRKETTPELNPAIRREALAGQVDEFLKSGGKIQHLPGNPVATIATRAQGATA